MERTAQEAACLAAAELLEEAGFGYEQFGSDLIRFEFRLPGKMQALTIVAQFDDLQMLVLSIGVLRADPADLTVIHALEEFLHRANFGFIPGSFELDYETGQVRYRICKFLDVQSADASAFRRALVEAVTPWLVFGDGLFAVLFGKEEPAGAVQDALKKIRSESPDDMLEELMLWMHSFAFQLSGQVQDEWEADDGTPFQVVRAQVPLYWSEGMTDLVRLLSAAVLDEADLEEDWLEEEEESDEDKEDGDDSRFFFA